MHCRPRILRRVHPTGAYVLGASDNHNENMDALSRFAARPLNNEMQKLKTRGGSSRAGALAVNGVAVFAGASCGPLVAQLPIGFTGLMLLLAALLMIAAPLVAISSRRTVDITV